MLLADSPAGKTTAGDVMQALRERYAAPEYALLGQVRDATGYGGNRTADAVALGLWPSRGIHLHGFEIKVYRGDWLRELKKPEKAEAVGQFCHYWWIVAPHGLIKVDELPSTWGLLELRGRRLQSARQAPFREDAMPADLPFIAAILRRAQATAPGQEELKAARLAGYKEGEAEGKKSAEYSLRLAKEQVDELEQRIQAFEQAAGVKLDRWNRGDIGAAVRRVLAGESGAAAARLASARQAAITFLDQTHDFASRNDIPWRRGEDPTPIADFVEECLPAEVVE